MDEISGKPEGSLYFFFSAAFAGVDSFTSTAAARSS